MKILKTTKKNFVIEKSLIKEKIIRYFLLKKFWMICLTIGFILFFNNCKHSSTSWLSIYEFVYINQTDYTLEFVPASYSNNVVILPQSSRIVVVQRSCEETIDKKCAKSILCIFLTDDVNKGAIVFIDETLCVEFFESGFVEILNYQYKMLGKRHVRYTYTFTETDFEEPKPCNQIN